MASPQVHDTGRRGERLALRFAETLGWQNGMTNVKIGRYEADVVCYRTDSLGTRGLLLEVKSSRDREVQPERLAPRQLQRLWRMAEILCAQKQLASIEVVLVLVALDGQSEHIRWLPLETF